MTETNLETLFLIGRTLLALPLGLVAGNLTVSIFNRIPKDWLCDYGEEPTDEKFPPGSQRIKSYPWKYLFSMFFVATAIWLFSTDWIYGIPTLVAIWFLVQLAIADKLYMILPDQYILALCLVALGFVPYYKTFLTPLYGALVGAGVMLAVGLLGKFIFKQETLGFGDIKLFLALGLITGPGGVSWILIATSLVSAVVYSIQIITKKIKKGDYQPLGHIIAFVSIIYLLFSHLHPALFKIV